jgi:hypothetical protein
MPFIGNKPSAVPLTSADIADGIITSAKIVDGTIVNADINASAAIASTKLSGITSPAGFRNIVINGDMQIAQRGTSTASVSSGSGFDCVDRFSRYIATAGTWTISQSTDVPTGEGFAKSLKFDCTTANASLSAGSEFSFSTSFEGQNLQYLKKGTASAESLTLSFWVKSTKTGTFIVGINDNDNARVVSKSYTVNTTNTWEYKTLTFPADATGAFDNDNASSVQLRFWLVAGTNFTSGTLDSVWGSQSAVNYAVGQVNTADSTANDFLITGVQLEAGTSATDFEFMPFDIDLMRCQRYYQNSFNTGNIPGTSTSATDSMVIASWSDGNTSFPRFNTIMRANPTITLRPNESTTTGQVNSNGTNRSASASNISAKGVGYITVTSGTANTYVAFTYEATAEL